MSLMKLLNSGAVEFSDFRGDTVPDEADISKVGEHLGKFYASLHGKTDILLENIHAEARRFQQPKPRRPSPSRLRICSRP